MTSQETPSSVASTVASIAAAFVATSSDSETADQVQSQPSEPIFLQTKLAQSIAGLFVGFALFLTCSQVRLLLKNTQQSLARLYYQFFTLNNCSKVI